MVRQSKMPHSRPQKILETDGGILHSLQHKPRILDTQPGPERRDMMLLASLAENLFGFAGTYAKEKKATLAPIQTGKKMGRNPFKQRQK